MSEETTVGNQRGEMLVHFHLEDGKHAMDAYVLNACEGHVLGLVRELARHFDIALHIEAHALEEGGVSVWLNLIGKHKDALTIIGSLVVAVLSAGQWVLHGQPLLKQQSELNELNIKKLRLELKKLEGEIASDAAKAPAIGATKPLDLEAPPTVNEVAPALEGSRKVVHLRSQFYATLLKDTRVHAVGFAPQHRPPPDQERVVRREQFAWYVVQASDLPPQRYEKVEVEVVAPVLQRRHLKWRGLFGNSPIAFEISDQRFLDKVTSKRVAFHNGTTLLCDVLVLSRVNEAGDVEAYSHTVEKVHRHFIQPTKPVSRRGKRRGLTAPGPASPMDTSASLFPDDVS